MPKGGAREQYRKGKNSAWSRKGDFVRVDAVKVPRREAGLTGSMVSIAAPGKAKDQRMPSR